MAAVVVAADVMAVRVHFGLMTCDVPRAVCRAVDWTAVLTPTSPLKLLYSLEIVNKLVSRGTDTTAAASEEAAKSWCINFLRNGGVKHLIKVLMTCDVDGWLAATLPKACLILTLRMVHAFIATPALGGEAVLEGLDSAALVDRLVRVLDAAIVAAREASAVRVEEEDDSVLEATNEVRLRGALRCRMLPVLTGLSGCVRCVRVLRPWQRRRTRRVVQLPVPPPAALAWTKMTTCSVASRVGTTPTMQVAKPTTMQTRTTYVCLQLDVRHLSGRAPLCGSC